MKEVAQLTGKLPFAGKHIVKKWFMDGVSDARYGETAPKVANAAALLGFAALHGLQMKMGISELSQDKSANSFAVGIDATYLAANTLAAYTQAYLATRVLTTNEKANLDRVHESVNHTTETVTPLELGVTLGGQILFLATYHYR